ncbi:hypothetical protein D3C86_1852960 [compost metagenome]
MPNVVVTGSGNAYIDAAPEVELVPIIASGSIPYLFFLNKYRLFICATILTDLNGVDFNRLSLKL